MEQVKILDDLSDNKLMGWCKSCTPERILSIPAEKVVDISELCPVLKDDEEEGQAILKYAQYQGHRIVEIWNIGWDTRKKKKKKIHEGCVHFHLEELTEDELAEKLYYCLVTENIWGISRKELARIVFEHAPIS